MDNSSEFIIGYLTGVTAYFLTVMMIAAGIPQWVILVFAALMPFGAQFAFNRWVKWLGTHCDRT